MKKILQKYQIWQVAIILSAVVFCIVTIPMAAKFYQMNYIELNKTTSIRIYNECILVFIFQYLTTTAFLSIPIVGIFLYFIFITCSLSISYFFFYFGKNLDPWVISDILSNFSSLTLEYASPKIIFYILIASFFISLIAKLTIDQCKKFVLSKSSIIFFSSIIVVIALFATFDGFTLKNAKRNYPPLNIYTSVIRFLKLKEYNEIKDLESKSLEIIQKSKLEYKKNSDKELNVIFIIGESARSDTFYSLLKEYSKLEKNKNIEFFYNVRPCENSTAKSIPCLLTNVDHKDWSKFLKSINIIDIFNKLKFRTSWIDNQSLYGYFDAPYSFLAKSSDFIIEEKFINTNSRKYQNYDQELIPYIESVTNNKYEEKNNKFTLVHLLGSHWHQEKRYPPEFRFFNPRCEQEEISSCSLDEVKNSYKNSIIYDYFVIEKILKFFEDKNAIVFFTSDHGYSLGETGVFGNAHDSRPEEQMKVPMFIWYSDYFKEHNKHLVSKLRQNNKKLKNKVTHEYIFNSIIGCSGVESNIVNNKLNLCY